MFKNALLASALGLSAYAVGAADARTHHGQPMGWYVAVEGGANWISDAGGQVDFGPMTVPLEAHFDAGWALLDGANVGDSMGAEAATGYRWGDPVLRPAVERILEHARTRGNDRLEQLAVRFLRA